MKRIFTTVLLLISLAGFAQNTEVITNQTIIELHQAGLSKEIIKSKIQSSTCNFDVSTDALVNLKKANVPDEVVNAMISKGSGNAEQEENSVYSKLSSGIYYFDSSLNTYVGMDPSILTNQKSGGLGQLLRVSVTGLFNSKLRASLSGKEANTKFQDALPSFIFVFDATGSGFSNSSTFMGNVQSPNEFFLVKLKVEKKSREIVVGKENNIKTDIGIDDDAKIPFVSKKLQNGVYQVSPTNNLKKGEYCFMFAASSMYSGQTHKVYDFSIKL
jgi:hypothetical protein